MELHKATQLTLNLIRENVAKLNVEVSIDYNSPDGDEGKFVLNGKTARVIAPFNGFFVNINLDWFNGSEAMPKIQRSDFYWYVFALSLERNNDISDYYICDYKQLRQWVLDFSPQPNSKDHKEHKDWRGVIEKTDADKGYFRWGDEPANQRKEDRFIKLNNINEIMSTGSDNLKRLNFWWVNQGTTYNLKSDERYLWAPLLTKDGKEIFHWKNLENVKIGDIVFHYADGSIRTISNTTSQAYKADKQEDNKAENWNKEGNRVDLNFFDLENPLPLNKVNDQIKGLGLDKGPINSFGGVNQGYLYELNDDAAKIILNQIEDIPEALRTVLKDYFKTQDKGTSRTDISGIIHDIHTYIAGRGYIFSEADIQNFYACLKSKPFILLAGISGTGKSKLARLFAESVSATNDNGQFELIPVRPDWNDNSDLIGYFDLSNTFQPGRLVQTLIRAWANPEKPHFVCLDEMNLARVEHYFSDFLSIIESRRLNRDGKVVTDIILNEKQINSMNAAALPNDIQELLARLKVESPKGICLPINVYIIGTVNMDETTYPFSRKVLDRANTIEFDVDRLSAGMELLENIMGDQIRVDSSFFNAEYITMHDMLKKNASIATSVSEKLESINSILRDASCQIGYRARDEASFYMEYALGAGMSEEQAEEYIVLQKILPRIQGSSTRIEKVLTNLLVQYSPEAESIKTDIGYVDSLISMSHRGSALVKKLCQMLIRFNEDGFTSFWG